MCDTYDTKPRNDELSVIFESEVKHSIQTYPKNTFSERGQTPKVLMLKARGKPKNLMFVLNHIWNNIEWREDCWWISIFVPIHKKDNKECANYNTFPLCKQKTWKFDRIDISSTTSKLTRSKF